MLTQHLTIGDIKVRTKNPRKLKVYNTDKEHVASFVYPTDAAAFLSTIGEGASIRLQNSVVWFEGAEDQPASESYDHVAETIEKRASCI
jgi:hypothetical protein